VSLEPGPRHVGLHVEQVHAADRWRIGTGVGSLTPLRYPLPEVLHNRVHSIHIEPDRVLLRGHVAEWREPVGVDQLERLVDRLRRFSNGVLRVPRHDDDGVLGGAVDRARAAESAP
jgi:hypothetical protein